MERRVKSPRLFWKEVLLGALDSCSDDKLQEAADVFARHPGAKFVAEIIHERIGKLTAGEAKLVIECDVYLEVAADKMKLTMQ